jgi:hypothetical protein
MSTISFARPSDESPPRAPFDNAVGAVRVLRNTARLCTSRVLFRETHRAAYRLHLPPDETCTAPQMLAGAREPGKNHPAT